MIAGLLKKWDLALTLQRGVDFAAGICAINGALPQQRDFYASFMNEWNL
jgi:hypothetical protein